MRLEGELNGIKLGVEHLHEALARSDRGREEAQRRAAEAEMAALAEKQAREKAEAALARAKARRPFWWRLTGRRAPETPAAAIGGDGSRRG
jgi:hypothetical protein